MFHCHHHHCMPRFPMPFMSFNYGMPFIPWRGCHNNFQTALGFGLGFGAINMVGKAIDFFV